MAIRQTISTPLTQLTQGAQSIRSAAAIATDILNDPLRYIGLHRNQYKPHGPSQLNDFASVLGAAGSLSRPNRFHVDIAIAKLQNGPSGQAFNDMTDASNLPLNSPAVGRRLRLMCDAAELPGRSFATFDHRTYGPSVKRPYQPVYSDITLGFICCQDMMERYFFDAWMNAIQDPETQDFYFSDDYSTEIDVYQEVDQANDEGKPHITYVAALYNAWPISLNASPLSFGAQDTYHRVDVTFAYKEWINKRLANVDVRTDAQADQYVTPFANTIVPPKPKE